MGMAMAVSCNSMDVSHRPHTWNDPIRGRRGTTTTTTTIYSFFVKQRNVEKQNANQPQDSFDTDWFEQKHTWFGVKTLISGIPQSCCFCASSCGSHQRFELAAGWVNLPKSSTRAAGGPTFRQSVWNGGSYF